MTNLIYFLYSGLMTLLSILFYKLSRLYTRANNFYFMYCLALITAIYLSILGVTLK